MSSAKHYQTAPEDRISLKQKSAYAVGMLVNNLQAAALPAMVVILNLGLGMDALWVGLIGAIPRIFDAISDPMVGYISDNSRTRWGRRRPFIFTGAILAGLIFAYMWQLPSGYINLTGTSAITPAQINYLESENVNRNDGGGIVFSYEGANQSEADITLYGPELLTTKDGAFYVSDLSGFPEIEINVDLPPVESLIVQFREAHVNGGDGESYSVVLMQQDSEGDAGNFYKFLLSDLKLDSGANSAGNGNLDLQAIQSVSLGIVGLTNAGTATIHSVKLRKDNDFYVYYFRLFMAMSILFFLAYTIYATPFVAFGYEMTPDYHERTRLHAFANTVGQLAWLGVPWFYAIMSSNLFRDTVHGARTLAIFVGAAVAILGLVPAIFLRERQTFEPVKKATKSVAQNTAEFFKGIVVTFKCNPFVKLCATTFLVFNGFQLGMSFSLYVMIYYLFNGSDGDAGNLMGWFGMLTSIATLGVIPLTGWIATRIGKQKTFMITISLSLLGYALKWVGYNPDHPYWLLIAAPFVAFGTGSLFTLMGSMISDVCDFDELETHQRREGVFGAIYWWMVKVGMALAGLMTGILLTSSGFDVALGAGQSEKTLFLLRIFDVGIPLVTSAIALAIMSTYSLTEQRAHDIRKELEDRRGKMNAAEPSEA
jgi:GPH family glycoside/pentoside/hexuronide:cation symporter